MKLASLKGGRDGRLVVVSNDLAWCADAGHIAPTLQAALSDWDRVAPDLANLATDIAHEAIPLVRFHEHDAAAPLPRAYHRAGAAGPDTFLAARDALTAPAAGCTITPELMVVTGPVAAGTGRAAALAAIRLVGLASTVSAAGAGAPLAITLSPVLVTPDALGDWWRDGRLHRTLSLEVTGQPAVQVDAANGVAADFGTLVVDAARTRALEAGTIIVAHQSPAARTTTSVRSGDSIRLWVADAHHHAVFGAIEQVVGG